MVLRHELRHTETMAQAMWLGGLPAPCPGEVDGTGLELHDVPTGSFELGASGDRFAYFSSRLLALVAMPATATAGGGGEH